MSDNNNPEDKKLTGAERFMQVLEMLGKCAPSYTQPNYHTMKPSSPQYNWYSGPAGSFKYTPNSNTGFINTTYRYEDESYVITSMEDFLSNVEKQFSAKEEHQNNVFHINTARHKKFGPPKLVHTNEEIICTNPRGKMKLVVNNMGDDNVG